ncbi:MAG TPA: hypothetical protein VGX96_07255 [Candidatus Elarobacter sp.]|jgi:hypothetical protein|nr:hypothetical protein [Candidatus Elarobacter sp.]
MRADGRVVNQYRAFLGLGFVVLGAVTLYRVAVVAAPQSNKILGVLLALAMIGLGATRLWQYARYKRESGP